MAIDQYTLDGIYIRSFDSIIEAAYHVGCVTRTISCCLRGIYKQGFGFKWKYRTYTDLEGEIFLPYQNLQVSNFGRVKGISGKVANVKPTLGGYVRIRTKTGSIAVHRIVATLFCDNPDSKPFVNHINGIKHDNHAGNLEWVTHQENMIHAELLHNNK